MNGQISIFSDAEQLTEAAARHFLSYADERRGTKFSVAFSGGTTPQAFYRRLTQAPYKDQIDWHGLHVFLADERCVPHDDADSNYRALRESMLDHVPIPEANIHMPAESGEPEAWAEAYNHQVEAFFDSNAPRFDLIVLGMGPDGHTASLFPGQIPASDAWICPVRNSPKPPPNRISFSIDLINLAHHILIMATGAEKAKVLADILRERGEAFPVGLVEPSSGDLIWMLDEASASLYSKP